jgi:hypothetical protein
MAEETQETPTPDPETLDPVARVRDLERRVTALEEKTKTWTDHGAAAKAKKKKK